MKVYMAKWFSGAFVTLGALLLLLGIWESLLQLPEAGFGRIVLGAVILLIGILYLNVPVFSLETDNIALYRPLGSVKQRFPFKTHSEIRIDGDKLFVGNVKVPIQKWPLNKSQWQAFQTSISR